MSPTSEDRITERLAMEAESIGRHYAPPGTTVGISGAKSARWSNLMSEAAVQIARLQSELLELKAANTKLVKELRKFRT